MKMIQYEFAMKMVQFAMIMVHYEISIVESRFWFKIINRDCKII